MNTIRFLIIVFMFSFNLSNAQYSHVDSTYANKVYDELIPSFQAQKDLNSIIEVTDSLITLFTKYDDWYYVYIQYSNQLANIFKLGNDDQFLQTFKKANKFILDKSNYFAGDTTYYLGKLDIKKIGFYYQKGNTLKVREITKCILKRATCATLQNKYKHTVLTAVFLFNGAIYNNEHNHENAITYFYKCIENTDPKNYYRLSNTYRIIASCYIRLNNNEEALNMLKEAHNASQKISDKNKIKITSGHYNFVLFNYYHKLNDINKCQLYLDKNKKINLSLSRKDFVSSIVINEYKLFLLKKDTLSAINILKAHIEKIEVDENLKSRETPEIYTYLALFYLNRKNYNDAISYINKAEKEIIVPQMDEDTYSIIKKNGLTLSQNNFSLYNISSLKVEILIQSYLDNNNKSTLEEAHIISEVTLNVLRKLKSEYNSREDKNILYSSISDLIENLLIICEEKELPAQDILNYFEASKSVVLQEYMQKKDALNNSSIPDSLIRQEKVILDQLNIVENEILLSSVNFEKKEALKVRKIELQKSLDIFYENLEKQYHNYTKNKYQNKHAKLPKLQELCRKNNQTIVYYFVGKKNLYTFIINSDKTTLKKTPISNLETDVQNLLGYINHPLDLTNLTNEELSKQTNKWQKNAFNIYNQIIAPFEDHFKENLLIIPDNYLAQIPFDVLVSSPNKKIFNFKSYNYLLNKYDISYAYSGHIYEMMTENKNETASQSLLGFAPSFNHDSFPALDYNQIEIENISKNISSQLFVNQDATIEHLYDNINNHSILHLASHAFLNTNQSRDSHIAFATSLDDINKLYVKDIYNYYWPLDLVTISACETGNGVWKRGEGVESIAQAFTYAGAKSLLTTLWSVNDKSTSIIMASFYKNLAKGMTKSKALKNAKLSYIKSHKKQSAHPFYWGSFIITGDNVPFEFNTNTNYLWYLTPICLIIGFIGFRFYGKKVA